MTTPAQNFVRGIDVSIFQGTIDWTKVAASGIDFATARASHGITGDSTFSTNWAGTKAANIMRGAYHYFIPTDDVQAQVDLFLKTVGTLSAGDLGVALDLEDPPAWASIAKADRLPLVFKWLNAVEAALGVKPFIYCSLNFIGQVFDDATALGAYPLWIAYYAPATVPPIPGVWKDWLFWQWSDTTTVPGIVGNVDGDRFLGTLADLQQLGVPALSVVAPVSSVASIVVPQSFESEAVVVTGAQSIAKPVRKSKSAAKSAPKMKASTTKRKRTTGRPKSSGEHKSK